MKWLFGIGAVMILAHLFFKYGARRQEERRIEETRKLEDEERQAPHAKPGASDGKGAPPTI